MSNIRQGKTHATSARSLSVYDQVSKDMMERVDDTDKMMNTPQIVYQSNNSQGNTTMIPPMEAATSGGNNSVYENILAWRRNQFVTPAQK